MKIMVSLDGSESSLRALDFIVARPWADDDQFLVVSVTDPDKGDMSIGQAMTHPDEVFLGDAEKVLASAKDRLQTGIPGRKIETSVLSGPVVETLIECAKKWGTDLIVMGSEGRKGVSRLLLGSVAEGVLRAAPCSVEIVRKKLS